MTIGFGARSGLWLGLAAALAAPLSRADQAVAAALTNAAPAAAPREAALDARVAALERELEALRSRVVGASPPTSEATIDPDFAAASAQDSTPRAGAPTEAALAPVSVSPMVKLNPDLSFILNGGFGWFTQGEHLRQGGHAIDENGFTLQALELAASASVDPYFRFDLYFQVQHLHLEEAFVTTLALPASLQARAGYFNLAFGRQNPQHLHVWNYVNPPLSHTRFMSEEHFGGAGAELSAILPVPWYSLVLVEAVSPSAGTAFRSATFSSVERNRSGRLDGLEDLLYVGRFENFVELSSDWSLLLGVSGAFGQSPYVPDNRAALYGADAYLKWRPLGRGGEFAISLTVEAVVRDTQVPRDSVRDWGGYAELDLQLSRRFVAGLRGDFTALLRGAAPDPLKFPARQERGSLSLTFLPTHFSKLRLQADLTSSRPGTAPVLACFAQVEVTAGEHGAHRF
jgi:hypothetical protein